MASGDARPLAPAIACVVMAAALTGCTPDAGQRSTSRSSSSPPAESATASGETPTGTTTGSTTGCRPTVPTAATIPGHRRDVLFGADRSFTNGRLWVGGLGEGGVIRARPRFVAPDGSVEWKLGWWREVPGDLTISGRRLDAAAPSLRAHVPSGYGDTGFQSSGVAFPTEGCWRLTGRVGATALSFVVSVVKT